MTMTIGGQLGLVKAPSVELMTAVMVVVTEPVIRLLIRWNWP